MMNSRRLIFCKLRGNCFWGGALRGAVEGIGEGKKGGTTKLILSPTGREKRGDLRLAQCFLSQ